MKRFRFEDTGCPCADCERMYGNPFDKNYRYRERQRRAQELARRKSAARVAEIIADIVRLDRERLIQEQE